MPQLQVSNKTLKLTNVLIAKMTAEDMQDMAFAEKTENYIKSKGYQPIGPIVQYTGVEQGENGNEKIRLGTALGRGNFKNCPENCQVCGKFFHRECGLPITGC